MIITLDQERAAITGAHEVLDRAADFQGIPPRIPALRAAWRALAGALEMYGLIDAGRVHWEAFGGELEEQLAWETLGTGGSGRLRDHPEPHSEALRLAATIAADRAATLECLLNGLERGVAA